MTFRARLSLLSLETRENPSVPGVDPIGGYVPPPTDPLPPTDDPATLAEAAVIAGATPTPPTDPLLGDNSVYKVPLLP